MPKFKLFMDACGNRRLNFTNEDGKGFSVQTLFNLPKTHCMDASAMKEEAVRVELEAYVAKHGTARQKRLLGLSEK